MAKDHYLPASLIGRFSAESMPSARERKVFVLRRGKRLAFSAKAGNIGYVNGLYDLARVNALQFPVASADPIITGYEPALPHALDDLEAGNPIGMETWLRVLVPYVASLFVRAHEFEPRYLARPSVNVVQGNLLSDSANIARLVEMERLLAPVCSARWVVLHKPAGDPFVLNDLGLTGTVDARTGSLGWALPVGKNTVLSIFPRHSRDVATYYRGKWWAIIEHFRHDVFDARPLSKSLACRATSYVVGASQEIVERLAPAVGTYADDATGMMEAWPFSHRTKREYSQEWYRLVTAIHGNPAPEDMGDLRDIRPSAVADGWYPAVSIFLNVREFPAGLKRNGGVISLTLESSQN